MPNSLSPNQIRDLARYGAKTRLDEIRTEIAAMQALLAAAPSTRRAGRKAASAGRPRRKRGKLSTQGRANIIAAQKARWAKLKSQEVAAAADTAAPAVKTGRSRKAKVGP